VLTPLGNRNHDGQGLLPLPDIKVDLLVSPQRRIRNRGRSAQRRFVRSLLDRQIKRQVTDIAEALT
jgi:hypothetical protein